MQDFHPSEIDGRRVLDPLPRQAERGGGHPCPNAGERARPEVFAARPARWCVARVPAVRCDGSGLNRSPLLLGVYTEGKIRGPRKS